MAGRLLERFRDIRGMIRLHIPKKFLKTGAIWYVLVYFFITFCVKKYFSLKKNDCRICTVVVIKIHKKILKTCYN